MPDAVPLVGAHRTDEPAARTRCQAAAAGELVGRLIVAPDLQGRGIGTRLLLAAERTTRLARATLFTGARSTANLRLYRRHGYVDAHRETVRPGLEVVHLVKELR